VSEQVVGVPADAAPGVRRTLGLAGRGLGPLVAAQAANAAGNFVSLALIARAIGPAGYGEFAVYAATALVVAQLSDAGLARAITLLASGDAERSRLGDLRAAYATAWALRGALHAAAIAGVATLAAVLLHAGLPLLAYFAAGSAAGLAVSLAQFAGGVLQAQRRFLAVAALNGLPGVFRVTMAVGLWSTGHLDLPAASVIYALSPLLAVAAVAPLLTIARPGDLTGSRRRQVGRLWRVARWLALAGAFDALSQRVDVIGLRLFSNATQTGVYAGAYIFISSINFVVLSVNALSYPVLAAAAARGDWVEARRLASASTAILAVFGIPLVAAVVTVFPVIATTVLGSGYAPGAAVMPLLGVFGVAAVLQMNTPVVYLAGGRPGWVLRWSIGLAVADAAAVVALVPGHGAAGAAAAIAAGAALMLPVSWWSVHRLLGPTVPWRTLGLTAALVAPAAAALGIIRVPGVALEVALAAVVWSAVTGTLVVLTARDTQPLLAATRTAPARSARA
jgi:O-antigen/teichoic acid export membrane protein